MPKPKILQHILRLERLEFVPITLLKLKTVIVGMIRLSCKKTLVSNELFMAGFSVFQYRGE